MVVCGLVLECEFVVLFASAGKRNDVHCAVFAQSVTYQFDIRVNAQVLNRNSTGQLVLLNCQLKPTTII